MFDLSAASLGILASWWLMVLAYAASSAELGRSGLFVQQRVGRHGKLFPLMKIRTMRDLDGMTTVVTRSGDPRITRVGAVLRKLKLDELPQLVNVLAGHMSFVGPRPDVPGYADRLQGEDRIVLEVRPGITGPATLKYRNEEQVLAGQTDPEWYNDHVIFPDKVRINRDYVENYSFWMDMKYILRTIVPSR